ncbi:MAG: HIRAN domain-containing protein [Treponema sp.]|nr:HIRAN domain-containing protein [Treponema sp.]
MKDGICPYEATCQAREACAESRAAEKQPSEKETAGRALCARVCVLANRMVKEISKKEAFAKAWAIARNGGLEISVAGVSYGSRQEALARLAAYDPKDVIALLVPEPDNPRDPDAIAVKVMVNNGKGIYTLGYVPRSETAVARAFLGRVPEIALVGGETKGARIRLAA